MTSNFSVTQCRHCYKFYATHQGACTFCGERPELVQLADEFGNLIETTTPLEAISVGTSKQKGNKIVADGYTFDSAGEYRRYQHLSFMAMAGEITNLIVHPKWELLPSFNLYKHFGKKTQSAVTYEADFSYFHEGYLIVEDFKAVYGKSKKNVAKGIAGKPIITEAARLRHKFLIWKLANMHGDTFTFRIVTDDKDRVGL